ncbi:MAG: hypothetical protein SVT52_05390 [Planctomycetota bacterium]|nr:hypothetical protein [Planctomycetota bacterium]
MSTLELAGIIAALTVAAIVLVLLLAVFLANRRTAASSGKTLEAADAVGNDVAELAVELDRLAEEIGRRADARLDELRRLCDEADGKIARLRELAAVRDTKAPPPTGGLRRAEILRLNGEGLSPLEIARRVEMDAGEVELILNLTRSKTD